MSILSDLNNRVSKIMRNDKLLFNIGDIIRITGLKRSQIHYWKNKGYIKPIPSSKNGNLLYNHHTLVKIQLIQSYLKSGFTLETANQRASIGDYFSDIISKIVLKNFKKLTKRGDQIIVDFGAINSNHELYFIVNAHNHNQIMKKIVNKSKAK